MNSAEKIILNAAMSRTERSAREWFIYKRLTPPSEMPHMLSWCGGFIYKNLQSMGKNDEYLKGIYRYNWTANQYRLGRLAPILNKISSQIEIAPVKSFGLNNTNNLYLIDFGFCKSYIKDNKHIAEKKTNNLIGSRTYASINAHNFVELTRRDDLESLGYMLIYFYSGCLSWHDISEIKNTNENIKNLKEKIIDGVGLPDILVNLIKYSRHLRFDENPNYFFIIDNFKKEIEILTKNS